MMRVVTGGLRHQGLEVELPLVGHRQLATVRGNREGEDAVGARRQLQVKVVVLQVRLPGQTQTPLEESQVRAQGA